MIHIAAFPGGKMGTVVKDRKVSDMTAGELQELIRQTVQEALDPDYGLELKPEIEEELKKSILFYAFCVQLQVARM